jgi:iron uptake system component EfeO
LAWKSHRSVRDQYSSSPVGAGIRAPFAISDSGEDSRPTGSDVGLVEQANQAYQAYVKDQTEQLVAKTEEFVGLYKAGRGDEARAL